MADRWIIIPGWDKFQHRDAGRSKHGLIWIRDHTDQLHKDAYRDLPYHLRGLLKDLRLAYGLSHGQLKLEPSSITRRLGQRTRMSHFERLADAGYIVISASKPAALLPQDCQPRREEKRTKAVTSTTDVANNGPGLLSKDLLKEMP